MNSAAVLPALHEQIRLLDSNDLSVQHDVQAALREHLSSGSDPSLLRDIIDYFVISKNMLALELLINVRESQVKNLFEKFDEVLRFDPALVINFLTNLVLRQPTWLHLLPDCRLFKNLLALLRDRDKKCGGPVVLVGGVLLLAALLPSVPLVKTQQQYRSSSGLSNTETCERVLNDVFGVFHTAAAIMHQSVALPEANVVHLRMAVYVLFLRLYGMYPCNFISYLRSHIAGQDATREQMSLFRAVIEPMLECVKLHPMLITATKDSEFSRERFIRMETHDMVVDCSRVVLDPAESASPMQSQFTRRSRNPSLHAQNQILSSSYASTSSFAWLRKMSAINSVPFEMPISAKTSMESRVVWPSSFDQARYDQPSQIAVNNDYLSALPPISVDVPEAVSFTATCDSSVASAFLPTSDGINAASQLWSPSMAVGLATPPGSRSRTPSSSQHDGGGGLVLRGNSVSSRAPSAQEKNFFTTPEKDARRWSDASSHRSRSSFGLAISRLFKPERESAQQPSPLPLYSSSSQPSSPIKRTAAPLPDVQPITLATSLMTDLPHTANAIEQFKLNVDLRRPSTQAELAEEAAENTSSSSLLSADGDDDLVQIEFPVCPPAISIDDLANVARRLSEENVLNDNRENETTDAEVEVINYGQMVSNELASGSFKDSMSAVADAERGVKDIPSPIYPHQFDNVANTLVACRRAVPLNRKQSILDTRAAAATNFGGIDNSQQNATVALSQLELSGIGDAKVLEDQQRRNELLISNPALVEMEPRSTKSLPRLSESGSLANFMRQVNRIRFNSQCHVEIEGQLHEATLVEDVEEQAVEDENLHTPPMRKRSMSCPSTMRKNRVNGTPHYTDMSPSVAGPSKYLQGQAPSVPISINGIQVVLPGSIGSEVLQNKSQPMMESDAPISMMVDVAEAAAGAAAADEELNEMFPYLKQLFPAVMQQQILAEQEVRREREMVNRNPHFLLQQYLEMSFAVHSQQLSQTDSRPPLKRVDSLTATSTTSLPIADSLALCNSNSTVESLREQLLLAENNLQLSNQLLLYEQFKRRVHVERNRRLYGRTKQCIALEATAAALKANLRQTEKENESLMAAIVQLRKELAQKTEQQRTDEYKQSVFAQQLQKENKEQRARFEQVLEELSGLRCEYSATEKELQQTKQRLFDVDQELQMERIKAADCRPLRAELDSMKRKLLVATDINKRLREMSMLPTSNKLADERVRIVLQSAESECKEAQQAQLCVRQKLDAERSKNAELDKQVHRKQQQNQELRKQLELMRASQKEHSLASAAKQHALMAVCQRLESQVLLMCKELELARADRRPSDVSRNASTDSPVEMRRVASQPKDIVHLPGSDDDDEHSAATNSQAGEQLRAHRLQVGSAHSDLYLRCLFDEQASPFSSPVGHGALRALSRQGSTPTSPSFPAFDS